MLLELRYMQFLLVGIRVGLIVQVVFRLLVQMLLAQVFLLANLLLPLNRFLANIRYSAHQ